jgi:hypothetical protein
VAIQRCAPPDMVAGLVVSPGRLGSAAPLHGALALARAEELWASALSTARPGVRL